MAAKQDVIMDIKIVAKIACTSSIGSCSNTCYGCRGKKDFLI